MEEIRRSFMKKDYTFSSKTAADMPLNQAKSKTKNIFSIYLNVIDKMSLLSIAEVINLDRRKKRGLKR